MEPLYPTEPLLFSFACIAIVRCTAHLITSLSLDTAHELRTALNHHTTGYTVQCKRESENRGAVDGKFGALIPDSDASMRAQLLARQFRSQRES